MRANLGPSAIVTPKCQKIGPRVGYKFQKFCTSKVEKSYDLKIMLDKTYIRDESLLFFAKRDQSGHEQSS